MCTAASCDRLGEWRISGCLATCSSPSLALEEPLSFCKTIVRSKQAAASIEKAHSALPTVQEVGVVHSVGPLCGPEVCISLHSQPSMSGHAACTLFTLQTTAFVMRQALKLRGTACRGVAIACYQQCCSSQMHLSSAYVLGFQD